MKKHKVNKKNVTNQSKSLHLGGAAICTPIASSSILVILDFFAPGLARIINRIDVVSRAIIVEIDFGIDMICYETMCVQANQLFCKLKSVR